jgi:hypothetical protein
VIRPFNGNVFLIGKYYNEVFPEKEFTPIDSLSFEEQQNLKSVNKINYSINMLPMAGRHVEFKECGTKKIINPDVDFLCLCTESSDEIEMFTSKSIQELIKFKWDTYAYRWHFVLWLFHQIYITLIFVYTYQTYVYPTKEHEHGINLVLMVMLVVPFCYEVTQAVMVGPLEYLTDLGNLVDVIFITSAIAMGIVHTIYNPYIFASKLLMWMIGILQFRRTFFFFKIFESYTPIVIMLTDVMGTLTYFGIFYFIDIVLYGMALGILGLNNYKVPGKYRDNFWKVPEENFCDCDNTFSILTRPIPGA